MAFYFFPCIANTKSPALEGDWRDHSTCDVEQADAWEKQGYNLALDVGKSGLAVIDLDGGAIGQSSWAELQAANGEAPATFTMRTPRGGLHYYFLGECANSVSKLGHKVDTRGPGGYVLYSGEVNGKSYSVYRDAPIAPLPEWIPAKLFKREKVHAAVEDLDLPQNITRGEAHLAHMQPVAQGQGADAKTYEVACLLRDFGISAERSIDMLMEHYKCEPRDERFEAFITRKVDSAWTYAQNEPGAWGLDGTAQDAFSGYLASDAAQEVRSTVQKPNPYRALSEAEQDGLAEPTWILPQVLPDHSITMLVGAPGTYKSFLALDLGMTLATGHAGWDAAAREPMDVVYVAGEGPRSIARLRRPAWRAWHKIDDAVPFHLVRNMPQALSEPSIIEFVDAIKAQAIHPKLVIIDTWARFMVGLNENDAKDAMTGINGLQFIAEKLNCSVLVVHHSGKNSTGSRGSNAIEGGVDAIFEVTAHKAVKVLEIVNTRMKDGEERERPWHFAAQPCAGSLVFRPMTKDDFTRATVPEKGLSAKIIASALRKLGADAQGAGVSTHVLASELYSGPLDETPDETVKKVDSLGRQLRGLARGSLIAYANQEVGGMKWWLP